MTAAEKLCVDAEVRESIVNDDPKFHEVFDVGDSAHQGDLIFVRIATLPKSAKPRAERQLAIGSTIGSRHVLTERAACYSADAEELSAAIKAATGCDVGLPYIGPVFVSPRSPTCDDVSHPEHGNQGFPAGAFIACVYQRSLDSEEREHRVRD